MQPQAAKMDSDVLANDALFRLPRNTLLGLPGTCARVTSSLVQYERLIAVLGDNNVVDSTNCRIKQHRRCTAVME
jgi:hypothetical protein